MGYYYRGGNVIEHISSRRRKQIGARNLGLCLVVMILIGNWGSSITFTFVFAFSRRVEDGKGGVVLFVRHFVFVRLAMRSGF